MEEGRGTISSQESTQATSMRPPRPEAGGSSSGTSRQTSHVWNYYSKEKMEEGDKFNVHCLLCMQSGRTQSVFIHSKGAGTGTLDRHLKNIHGITKQSHESGAARGGQQQTQLGGFMSSSSGGGMPFSYNKERMIDEFARYITLDELPFSTGESQNLEYFIKTSLNPAYTNVPRNTLKRRTQKQYYMQRAQLIELFNNFDGMVSLTSDCWTSSQGEPFICVTAHWIDHDYLLQKRILAFDVMDEAHSGFNLSRRIIDLIKEFNLFNKIFSISLDNASANTKAIEYIRQDLPTVLDGQFLHIRCCAHIINLSAQSGLSQITTLLEPIRKIIKYLRRDTTVRRDYKKLCREHGLVAKKWGIDCPTRWNSTYKILKYAIKYKVVITELYNSNPKHQNEDDLITEFQWELACRVRDILECFAHATKVFSFVYEPNVHHVIIECVSIITTLKEYENDDYFSFVIGEMKTKWTEYFTEFPYIYGVACILDPGVKMEGLENMLEHYYTVLGIEYEWKLYTVNCLNLLYRLVDVYIPKTQNIVPPKSSSSSGPRFNSTISNIIGKSKKARISTKTPVATSATSMIYEFFSYNYELDEDFEILTWWKNHETQFPVLAKVARDVLVVPASTIASESAFSAGKRVLDEKRTSLSPDMIKICVCKKDWDQAAKREQGKKSDDSDEDDPMMIMDTSDSTDQED